MDIALCSGVDMETEWFALMRLRSRLDLKTQYGKTRSLFSPRIVLQGSLTYNRGSQQPRRETIYYLFKLSK